MKTKYLYGIAALCSLIIGAVLLLNYNGKLALEKPAALDPLASTQTASASSSGATTTKNNLPTGMPSGSVNSTYFPGATRPLRASASQFGSTITLKTLPHWWLYAQSEAQAAWMDRFGYPTVAEEERLMNASDAELATLIANGDVNAKAHQVARLAKAAFASGVDREVKIAFGQMYDLLMLNGPYQALTIRRNFGEMLQIYHDLPEAQKTDEKRAIIRKFDDPQQMANLIMLAFGNEDFVSATDRILPFVVQDIDPRLKWPTSSGESAMHLISGMASMRAMRGLPPLVIDTKPYVQESTTMFERY